MRTLIGLAIVFAAIMLAWHAVTYPLPHVPEHVAPMVLYSAPYGTPRATVRGESYGTQWRHCERHKASGLWLCRTWNE